MGHRFSIATLMLLTAIAAIALASMRGAIVRVLAAISLTDIPTIMSRVWNGDANELVLPIAVGAIAGLIYAVALALWNKTGWVNPIVSGVGGLLLGGGAGSQMTTSVAWPVVAAAPVVLLSMVTLIAFNRRRRRFAELSSEQSSFESAA